MIDILKSGVVSGKQLLRGVGCRKDISRRGGEYRRKRYRCETWMEDGEVRTMETRSMYLMVCGFC